LWGLVFVIFNGVFAGSVSVVALYYRGLARVSVGVGFKLLGCLGWVFAFRLSVALKMRLGLIGLGGWVVFLLWGGGVAFVTTRHGLI